MTKPALFSQADLRRAMKAAKQAGYSSPRIIVRPNGELVIDTGAPPANDQDEVELK